MTHSLVGAYFLEFADLKKSTVSFQTKDICDTQLVKLFRTLDKQ
jgi:hypothetical protein